MDISLKPEQQHADTASPKEAYLARKGVRQAFCMTRVMAGQGTLNDSAALAESFGFRAEAETEAEPAEGVWRPQE